MKFDYAQLIGRVSARGKHRFFIFMGITGIALILLSEITPNKATEYTLSKSYEDEYRKNTEQRLTQLLKDIEGAGNVKVMLTVECSGENIYAQQNHISEDIKNDSTHTNAHTSSQVKKENEIVVISGQDGDEALVEKTMVPEIKGVAVVCSGADDISVVSAVTNTVSVVLGIPTNRIYVTKMR